MKKKKLKWILTFLLISFLLVATLVSGTVKEAATISGYHEDLFTSTLHNYKVGGGLINFEGLGLLVEKSVRSNNLISTGRVGVNVDQGSLDNRLQINLVDGDDRLIVDRASSGAGNLLSFRIGSAARELIISEASSRYVIQTSANRHINLDPSGRIGIKIGSNNPSAGLDVGGNARIGANLDMSNRHIRQVADPTSDFDAVTYGYAYNQILNMESSRWTREEGDDISYSAGHVIVRDNPLSVSTLPPVDILESLFVQGNIKISDTSTYWQGDNMGREGTVEFQNAENVRCWLTMKGGIITNIQCQNKLYGNQHSREDCTDAGGEVHYITSGPLAWRYVCKFDVSAQDFYLSVNYCENNGWTGIDYYASQTKICESNPDAYGCYGSTTLYARSFSSWEPSIEEFYGETCDEFDESGHNCLGCHNDTTKINFCAPNIISIGCY